MRTTVDLPEDLHQQAQAIARDTHRTLSETIADLMRRGLGHGHSTEVSRSAKTGLPTELMEFYPLKWAALYATIKRWARTPEGGRYGRAG